VLVELRKSEGGERKSPVRRMLNVCLPIVQSSMWLNSLSNCVMQYVLIGSDRVFCCHNILRCIVGDRLYIYNAFGFFNSMRYINLPFTYLLACLCTHLLLTHGLTPPLAR